MIFKAFLRSLVIVIGLQTSAWASPTIDLMTTSGCACCELWARRMRDAGFTVNVSYLWSGEITRAKLDAGIPILLSTCHTATVNGYVIEGHVPAAEIHRLISESPKALGLVLPGMPLGSPGMDTGTSRDSFDVLLLMPSGATTVYAAYPAAQE